MPQRHTGARTPTPDAVADLAVAALRAEADLAPKPGLVDPRDNGAHTDMDHALLVRSADALRGAFAHCARLAVELPLGPELRARIGAAGRAGERQMLQVTGGVNTHRGALWAVGLLAAGAARRHGIGDAVRFAAGLARLPDSAVPPAQGTSHGAGAGRRYGAPGARGEAAAGFPHVTGHALPMLRRARARGADETSARLDALLSVMAHLPDTCVLHRGGPAGLAIIQRGAADVLAVGGTADPAGRRRLSELDALALSRRLSPGGSADLLAAALFLDSLPAAPKTPPAVKGHTRSHADTRLPFPR
ncbi:triphosphoribosyl-dephospho-CoA synthase MdcB [Streptomyces griseiscabiei]|uniref:triphosphoribosyl-dephospho-CoA synthase n=1 Tax=Streptomyces griseiscabiei TaxID=2993540 RepID=A0ABU4LL35_9ACTN|nr:triphosphoribosyl-dephospho-CoA synthase MdcB [Streptomyces griseiscabiei]MBZ3900365.1 triphosphoribosyl-dephospho-CoA synthase MdcB [Streptomyces griseiscabiei]MDX2916303.1 triphosphoribosyl-dephospho-CoA synthase MdcB [Streptomyces griseiscabiei]